MKAGAVEVTAEREHWTLRTARSPETRAPAATNADLASKLGLRQDAIADTPLWVDTGAEQLVIPLRSAKDVREARPNAVLLGQHGFSERRGAAMAYAWAIDEAGSVVARFFFLVNGGLV